MSDSRFTPIPNSLIENNTLSSGAILLFMRLIRRGGYVRASMRAIADQIGMKKDRVFRYLHELEDAGLIRLAQVDDDNSFLTVTQVEIISKGADNDADRQ